VFLEYSKSPLKGLLSPRVQLLNHQLYIAEKLGAQNSVHAILADEVGLGKTIEAGLIYSRLRRRNVIQRSLIVIPESLQTQWMSEFYRKFYEIFTWIDEERWEQDLESQGASSFAVNNNVLVATELLDAHPEIYEDLLKHQWDLIIFDEAHKLCGENYETASQWTKAAAILQNTKSALLLSATPERAGPNTLDALLKLLNSPQALVFRNRRQNFPGFPKRQAHAHFYEGSKLKWLLPFLQNFPPRDKILILTQSAEDAIKIHNHLKNHFHSRVALFTEKQDFITRDKQAAWFASDEKESAQVLISSSLGGEGRNFQSAHDLVLWDMPHTADTLEQRIGRIDRIGQGELIDIHVPLKEDSQEEILFEFFMEGTGSFKSFCPFAYEIEKACNPLEATDRIEMMKLAQKAYRTAKENYEESLKKESLYLSSPQNQEIRETIEDWENKSDTRDCLLGVLDVFGIDYKADTYKDSFHVHSEALMFLEHFPGLNPEENKSISFNRNVAIERGEFDFVSVEHPFFEGACDAFYQAQQGKVGLCGWENPTWTDRYLVHGFFIAEDGRFQDVLFNEKGEKSSWNSTEIPSKSLQRIAKAMAKAIAQKAAPELKKSLENIENWLTHSFPEDRWTLDSFFLYLPLRN